MTETAQLASVVLPAASFAEKDGTFTNTERRVQLLKPAVKPPGQAKPDWEIISLIAKKMGVAGFDFKSQEEIFEEVRKTTPQYAGMTYARLSKPEALHWPCPAADHPGTPILHMAKFSHPDGLGIFFPVSFKPPAEVPDAEYPFILTTGRMLFHYHTGSMTRRSATLDAEVKTGFVEINPAGCQGSRRQGRREGQGQVQKGRDRDCREGHQEHHEGHYLRPVPLRRMRSQHADQPGPGPVRKDARVQGLRREDHRDPEGRQEAGCSL